MKRKDTAPSIQGFTGRTSEGMMQLICFSPSFDICLSSPAGLAFWFGAAAGGTSFIYSHTVCRWRPVSLGWSSHAALCRSLPLEAAAVRKWWLDTSAPPSGCRRSQTASWLVSSSPCTCRHTVGRWPKKQHRSQTRWWQIYNRNNNIAIYRDI